jgi:CRP-like cAMP-binding protein
MGRGGMGAVYRAAEEGLAHCEYRLLPETRTFVTTSSCSVCIPMTQEDIAAMAGTSRAPVDRVLRKEERDGSVALARGRTTVLDRDAIECRCRSAT